MFQVIQLAQSVAPYCGLLIGICAFASTSHTALFGGEEFPSRAPIEAVLAGRENGHWLRLEHGTLLMTELVVDTEIANGSGAASPNAYLVPYVAKGDAGPSTAHGAPARGQARAPLAIIRFEPDDFAARFPAPHAVVHSGGALDEELLDVVFDRRPCEVLRADTSDLSPHLRHFLLDRWGIEERALLLFDAGAKPMPRALAVLLASTGLGVALAAALALLHRRAQRQAASNNGW